MNGCKEAKTVTVIKTVTVVGNGTEENPVRRVVEYWTLDGRLLCSTNDDSDYYEQSTLTHEKSQAHS